MSNTPVALSAAERKALLRAAMKIVGSVRTPKKAAASARNGRLGGRPKKNA